MAMKFTQFSRFTWLTQFSKSEKSVNSGNSVNSVNSVNYVNFLLLALCSLLVFVVGCASLQQKEAVLAVVNGEPITERDLRYSLEVAHRREDLSSAGALNLSQFIQKMVDDRLVIQEARRMGAEDYPEVQQAIHAYILRESVVKLHDEEIVRKVTVTDEDIKSYYDKNYERISLGIIEVDSEQSAQEILEQLKQGVDFEELVQRYSTHSSKKAGGEVVLRRNSMSPQVGEAIANLKPGEFSDVLKIQNKYYVVEYISREEAPDAELANVRGNIEKSLRKQKEKERGDEYLKYLREQAKIKIDDEIFRTINISHESERVKLLNDERVLVQINGMALTIGDFASLASTFSGRSKERILDDWIDQKVVDREALSRQYEKTPELDNMIARYKNQLLKNTFIKRVVVPQITISDEVLKDYYASHQESFTKPTQFKVQQITVKTIDDAHNIMNNLQTGADFSWLAKNQSVDSAAQEGGSLGWIVRAEMPEPVKKIIETLHPGDVSPILQIDSNYRIIQLIDRREGEVEEFDKVRNAVYRAAFEEKVKSLLNNYVTQLKKDAEISVDSEAVRLLEEKVEG